MDIDFEKLIGHHRKNVEYAKKQKDRKANGQKSMGEKSFLIGIQTLTGRGFFVDPAHTRSPE